MIKKLNNIFLLNGKLLYASEELVGYNPVISPGFNFTSPGEGTTVQSLEFSMDGDPVTVILMYNIRRGPTMIRSWIEIVRYGFTLIRFETGGCSLGYGYSFGKKIFTDKSCAYALVRGHDLADPETKEVLHDLERENYYLLRFRHFTVPRRFFLKPTEYPFFIEPSLTAEQLEQHRQTEWEAKLNTENEKYMLKKSTVPGFAFERKDEYGKERYRKHKSFHALSKLDVENI